MLTNLALLTVTLTEILITHISPTLILTYIVEVAGAFLPPEPVLDTGPEWQSLLLLLLTHPSLLQIIFRHMSHLSLPGYCSHLSSCLHPGQCWPTGLLFSSLLSLCLLLEAAHTCLSGNHTRLLHTLQYHHTLHNTITHSTIRLLLHTAHYYHTLHNTMTHCTILLHTARYHHSLHHNTITIIHCTILSQTPQYYSTLYNTITHRTILPHSAQYQGGRKWVCAP